MSVDTFKPINSTKTRLVTVLANGVRIYAHTAKDVRGEWLAVRDNYNWVACDSRVEATREAMIL